MRPLAVTWLVLIVATASAQPWHPDRGPRDVRVQLVDPEGAPVTGVEVACVPRDHSSAPRLTMLSEQEKAVTDEQGFCRFSGLTYYGMRDSYLAFATHGTLCAYEVISLGSESDVFVLPLKSGRPVYGLVRDDQGRPLQGVVVSISKQLPLAITGADGLFTIPVLPANSGELSFALEGYGSRELHPWTRVEIVLEPGGLIEGRVIDDQGQMVPEAMVSFHAKEGGAELVTDADGCFVTPWIAPAQELDITVYKNTETANWNGRSQCAVVVGERRQHLITVKKEVIAPLSSEEEARRKQEYQAQFTTVSGSVVMAEKKTPVPATLYGSYTNSSMGDFGYSKEEIGHTDASGKFVIDEVPKGRPGYVLAMPADPLLYAVEGIVRIDPAKGPVTGLVLTAAPGAAVTGNVTRSDGEPVVEGDVILLGNGMRRDHFLEHSNRFRFPNLPPGRYTVQLGDTTLDLGELAAGELREDVEFVLPAPDAGTLVEGTLVDSGGAPIGGANINFHAESAHEYAETDAAGHFAVRVKQPGTYRIEAWEPFGLARLGESATGIGQPVALEGTTSVEIPVAGRETLALTGTPTPWPQPVVGGTVRDASGKALDADVHFIFEQSRTDYVEMRDGTFSTERVPKGPFLLEVSARGYETRVLEADTDFSRSDRGLQIVLEEGPFEDTPSIWSQVTGRPATEEAVAAMACGKYVRDRIEYYRSHAMPAVAAPQCPRTPNAPGMIDVLVVDSEGKPVPRVVVRQWGYVSDPIWYEFPWLLRETQDASREIMNSPTGAYTIPNGLLLQADGMATVSVSVKSIEDYAPPIRVVLNKPASIEVRVRDYEDDPVEGAVAMPPEVMMRMQGSATYLPKSDARGIIRLSELPAGQYVLAVTYPENGQVNPWASPMRLVALTVQPGGTALCEVAMPVAVKAGPGSLLVSWERRMEQGALPLEQLPAAVKGVTSLERKRIAALALAQLEQMPGFSEWNHRQIVLFAQLAAALGGQHARKAVPELVRILGTDLGGANANNVYLLTVTQPVFDSIASIEGERALKDWAALASNASAAGAVRANACIMLATMGTEASVEAWAKVRDEARALPGAPPVRELYTHAQRMAETAQFVLGVLGGEAYLQVAEDTAWVDAEYATGRMSSGNATLEFRRFEDEWMLVKVEPMPVP